MPYIANKYHRKVRKTGVLPDGIIEHETYSFTRDDGTKYEPLVDTQTGMVQCHGCPDFAFRCAGKNPGVLSNPEYLCKHLIRAILGCVRRHEIDLPEEQLRALHKAAMRQGRGPKPKPLMPGPPRHQTAAAPRAPHSFGEIRADEF